MSRINVYIRPEDNPDGTKFGWFDDSKADWFREDTRWDGSDNTGVMSGIPAGVGYEGLHRTVQGRWVREHNAVNYYNGKRSYEFLTDEQAREWFLRNGDDEIVEKFFGPLEEERGPGNPEGGVPVNVRLSQEILDRLDTAAKDEGISRDEKICQLVTAGLS